MVTRGTLYRERAPADVQVMETSLGFIHCLSAMQKVEAGEDVFLIGDYNFPQPYRRMLERIELGLRSAPAQFIGQWPSMWKDGVVLLVGERPSALSLPNWPFISANHAGCAVWLSEQLENAGIPEANLCWVNAFNRQGELLDLSGISTFPFRRIIALGRQASDALGKTYHLRTHHPQYWKKVFPNRPYYLIKQIWEAL